MIKLTPTMLTFQWQKCPQCVRAIALENWKQPYEPFPSIFGKIDKLMRGLYAGAATSCLHESLPPGTIDTKERSLKSTEFNLTGCQSIIPFYFSGKTDGILLFNDGTIGILDFKTSEPKPESIDLYRRQLHSYAWMLEHPLKGSAQKVRKLGLLFGTPESAFAHPEMDSIGFRRTWVEIERNDEWFRGFLSEVMDVFTVPPIAAAGCDRCELRQFQRRYGV